VAIAWESALFGVQRSHWCDSGTNRSRTALWSPELYAHLPHHKHLTCDLVREHRACHEGGVLYCCRCCCCASCCRRCSRTRRKV